MIRFKNVWAGEMRGHPSGYLLRNITCDFPPGRHTAILCTNKQAMACLHQLLCGMNFPQYGKIIRGASVSWPVGWQGVFDPHLTCRENLLFLARIHGVPSRPVCDFVADFTGLGELLPVQFGLCDANSKSKIALATPFALTFEYYLGVNHMLAGEKAFHGKCLALISKMKMLSTLIILGTNARLLKLYSDNLLLLHNGSLNGFDR